MSTESIKSIGQSIRQIDDPNTRRVLESVIGNIGIIKESLLHLEAPAEPDWMNLTLQNGWSDLSADTSKPKYTKINDGNIVFLRGIITGGTTTGGTVIANLPKGYRPLTIDAYPIASNGGSGNGRLIINPNGDLTIGSITNNADITIHGYFFAEI